MTNPTATPTANVLHRDATWQGVPCKIISSKCATVDGAPGYYLEFHPQELTAEQRARVGLVVDKPGIVGYKVAPQNEVEVCA